MASQIFTESLSGQITHTAISRVFELADERFQFEDLNTPEGSAMSIIQATWL